MPFSYAPKTPHLSARGRTLRAQSMFARPLALNRALVAAAAARREAGAADLRVSCAAEHRARPGGAPSCERVVADMTAGAGRLTGWEPPAAALRPTAYGHTRGHVCGPRPGRQRRGTQTMRGLNSKSALRIEGFKASETPHRWRQHASPARAGGLAAARLLTDTPAWTVHHLALAWNCTQSRHQHNAHKMRTSLPHRCAGCGCGCLCPARGAREERSPALRPKESMSASSSLYGASSAAAARDVSGIATGRAM